MTTKELQFFCKKYANVYLPCTVYGSALSYYQEKNACDRSTAFDAIGLKTGSEIANILWNNK